MVSTPKPPDPKETAAAQAGMNRDTATTQQLLNMTNQVGPDGSLTYKQSGVNTFRGADGKLVTIPQFTATTTLSDMQQQIKAQSDQASLNLGKVANNQSAFLNDYLGKPVTIGNEETEARLFELGSKRLDPRFAQEEEGLRTRLLNSGIREGTAAYDSAFGNFSQGKNDAYNQLLLTGRGQAVQEQLAERNQPLNELSALMSGSQVSMPQFGQTPQTGVAGVDYAGLVGQEYQAKLANSQATMGGLFGLASAGIGLFSDRRLKHSIKPVGTLDNGLRIYAYRMGSGPFQIGLMADEVEGLHPDAVILHPSGYKMVRYELATEAA